MRSNWLVWVFFVLIACKPAIQPAPNITAECSPPYHEYTKGDCCLDNDANSICDRDEPQKPAEPVVSKTEEAPAVEGSAAITEAIAKFEQGVSSYSYKLGDTQHYVVDDLIHIELDKAKELGFKINETIRVHITDIFVDRTTKDAVGYCDPRSEERIVGEFNADRSKCIKLIDMPFELDYKEHNPTLPEDWLYQYKDRTPALVEEADQYVKEPSGWKAVNPVVHFLEGKNTIILRLDIKTGLPLRVEINKQPIAETISYSFFVHNKVKPEQVAYKKFAR